MENPAETVRSTVFFDTADMKKIVYLYHKNTGWSQTYFFSAESYAGSPDS